MIFNFKYKLSILIVYFYKLLFGKGAAIYKSDRSRPTSWDIRYTIVSGWCERPSHSIYKSRDSTSNYFCTCVSYIVTIYHIDQRLLSYTSHVED